MRINLWYRRYSNEEPKRPAIDQIGGCSGNRQGSDGGRRRLKHRVIVCDQANRELGLNDRSSLTFKSPSRRLRPKCIVNRDLVCKYWWSRGSWVECWLVNSGNEVGSGFLLFYHSPEYTRDIPFGRWGQSPERQVSRDTPPSNQIQTSSDSELHGKNIIRDPYFMHMLHITRRCLRPTIPSSPYILTLRPSPPLRVGFQLLPPQQPKRSNFTMREAPSSEDGNDLIFLRSLNL